MRPRLYRRCENQNSVATWSFKLVSQTFFFKGHILAGQCQPVAVAGIQDFAWLVKEEIQSRVDADYWEGVKDMLSDY